MSFRLLLEAAQAQSLADKLAPTEVAIWESYCRSFSVRFSTPLLQVMAMDPFFVVQQVNSDQLSEFEPEERLDDLRDMLGHLSDPSYDAKREQAIREELRQLEEQEAERLREGREIHPSLKKDKRVIAKEEPKPKELPKSGGIRMDLINQLNNQDKEG
jgi:hypothetical protein